MKFYRVITPGSESLSWHATKKEAQEAVKWWAERDAECEILVDEMPAKKADIAEWLTRMFADC